MSFQIGDRVAGYEIVAPLGAGGMGRVFRVRNLVSDREEAMKVLLSDLEHDRALVDRFLREIKLQARLSHRNIVSLHNAIEAEGRLVMVLELLDGVSLAEKLQKQRVTLAEAVDYTCQALEGLEYAHSSGVVHRDIKPSNMMLTVDGTLKLMDFGIAKALSDKTLTVSGSVLGSVHYMSPEQVQGSGLIDHRTDLYSLGVVLYEMATGSKPFRGDSEFQIMSAHLQQQPAAPAEMDAAVPAAISQIILQSMAKDPAARFADAKAFLNALQAAASRLQAASPAAAAPTVPATAVTEPTTASGRTAPVPAAAAETGEVPPPPPPRRREPPRPSVAPTAVMLAATALGVFVLGFGGYLAYDYFSVERVGSIPSAAPEPMELGRPAEILEGPDTVLPQAADREPATKEAMEPPAMSGAATRRPSGSGQSRPAGSGRPAAVEPVTAKPSGLAERSETPPNRPISPPPRTEEVRRPQEASNPLSTKPVSRPASKGRPSRSTPAPALPVADQSPPPLETSSPEAAPPPAGTPAPAAGPGIGSEPASAPPGAPDRVYELSEVMAPQLIHRVSPDYSPAARQARIEGKVRLEAEVWPDGKAHHIRVIRSVGHPDLDRNAVEAFKQWVFSPAIKDGQPVKVRVTADLSFRLL